MREHLRFEDWEAEQMKRPEFRAEWEKLEAAYQVGSLRLRRGLSQEELAARLGTTQSSIARLEAGRSEPRLAHLRRIAQALNARVELRLVPIEETAEVVALTLPAEMFSAPARVEERPAVTA